MAKNFHDIQVTYERDPDDIDPDETQLDLMRASQLRQGDEGWNALPYVVVLIIILIVVAPFVVMFLSGGK